MCKFSEPARVLCPLDEPIAFEKNYRIGYIIGKHCVVSGNIRSTDYPADGDELLFTINNNFPASFYSEIAISQDRIDGRANLAVTCPDEEVEPFPLNSLLVPIVTPPLLEGVSPDCTVKLPPISLDLPAWVAAWFEAFEDSTTKMVIASPMRDAL